MNSFLVLGDDVWVNYRIERKPQKSRQVLILKAVKEPRVVTSLLLQTHTMIVSDKLGSMGITLNPQVRMAFAPVFEMSSVSRSWIVERSFCVK